MTTDPRDPEDMLGYIDRMADDLENGWKLGMELPFYTRWPIHAVVIAGMGGSAIAGDMLVYSLRDRLNLPVVSHRDYGLPNFAHSSYVLVICSSHSGNTEEVLSAFEAGVEAGCTVLALTTGGKLKARAEALGKPLWTFEHKGQPRTAMPLTFGMLAALMHRLKKVEGLDEDIADAISVLRQEKPGLTASSELAQNPARRLAGQLLERNIAVFAAGQNEVVARRWKTQINELAKSVACFEGLPEMNHNTLAGLERPEGLLENSFALFLRAASDHPQNAKRLEYSQQACMMAGMGVDSVWGKGVSRLAQMWSLVQFGDYLSYYLALDYGVDPTPVDALGKLKDYLAS